MGLAKRAMEPDPFTEFLRELVSLEDLENPAIGITKQVIEQGEDNLTPKQRFVFQRDVLDNYIQTECDLCGDEIPWEEMLFAILETGVCSWCYPYVPTSRHTAPG